MIWIFMGMCERTRKMHMWFEKRMNEGRIYYLLFSFTYTEEKRCFDNIITYVTSSVGMRIRACDGFAVICYRERYQWMNETIKTAHVRMVQCVYCLSTWADIKKKNTRHYGNQLILYALYLQASPSLRLTCAVLFIIISFVNGKSPIRR